MTVLRTLFSGVTAFLALTSVGLAAPTPSQKVKRQAPQLNDIDILNFALTLEHLEAAFYKEGFERFPAADFLALGLDQRTIDGLIKIGETEATHVTVLTATIERLAPGRAVRPCTYNFGVNSAAEMVQTAKILEAVGVAAYLGAAGAITDPAVLAAAASIVTVEARHNTEIRNALKEQGVPQAFDISSSPRQIFTLAAQFITECPPGSELPFVAFPNLEINNAAAVTAGNTLSLRDPAAFAQSQQVFCSFNSGESGVVFAAVQNGGCAVPQGLTGEVFVTLTDRDSAVTDDNILAGPAILVFS